MIISTSTVQYHLSFQVRLTWAWFQLSWSIFGTIGSSYRIWVNIKRTWTYYLRFTVRLDEVGWSHCSLCDALVGFWNEHEQIWTKSNHLPKSLLIQFYSLAIVKIVPPRTLHCASCNRPLVSSHTLPPPKKKKNDKQCFNSSNHEPPAKITTAFLFIFPKCSRDSTQNGEDLCMNNGYTTPPKPWCKSHWSTSTEAACDIQAHSQLGERLKQVFGKAPEFIAHRIHVWYI